jgi:cobalt-zinc-cadmium efflux system outer membrane protein
MSSRGLSQLAIGTTSAEALRMMRRTILAAAIWSSVAYAQPPHEVPSSDDSDGPEARSMLPIRLDDVIEVAVRQAPDLMRAKIDRVAALDAAEGQGRAQAWILSSAANLTRSGVADHTEVAPSAVVSEDTIGVSLGIGRNLPTGGSFSLELGVQHTKQEFNAVTGLTTANQTMPMPSPAGTDSQGHPLDTLDQSQSSLKATLKQPLLRGFGPGVALAPQHKADLAASEATVKAQLAAEQMVKDVVDAYWDLSYAAFEVDVRQQALELARKQELLTHEQMRAGAAPSTAIDQVTYELATREEALLAAQLALEQKSLELRRKAGLELGRRDIVMQPGEPFEIGREEFDVDEVLERSHQANRQLASVQLEKKLADVDVAVAEDAMKPQVDLNVSGALIGFGPDTGDSLSGIGNGDSYQVTAGLSISLELSGAARKNRDAALAKRRRLDVDRADLVRQIDSAVVTSVHTVTAARTRVALADKAIAVAEEVVRTERASFIANRSSNIQVLKQQTALVEARLRRGKAIIDYHQAVAQLQFLSGTLLEQYRVNVRTRRS